MIKGTSGPDDGGAPTLWADNDIADERLGDLSPCQREGAMIGAGPPASDPNGGGIEDGRQVGLVPRLVTVVDAARLLGIGRSTMYELIGAGDIEVVHIRRSVRVPLQVLDAYVERLQRTEGR